MTKVLPWLLLVFLGLIWGTNFLFMKMAVAVVSPLEVVWLRTLFGALPIGMFALATRSLDWRDWRYLHHFAAMALLANIGPYVFFVLGTQHLPSGVAGVISGSIPFITAAIVAVALPSEVLTRAKVVAIAVGFCGVVLVAPLGQAGSPDAGATSLTGLACMLAGSVCYALALVYAKRFIAPLTMSAVKLASYQMTLAFVFLIPFAAPGHWSELILNPKAFLGLILGLGLLGTGVAFVIYYYLIATLGALKASSVYYIPPVVAMLVGALFANEAIGLRQIGGAILIMTGIYFADRPARASKSERPVTVG